MSACRGYAHVSFAPSTFPDLAVCQVGCEGYAHREEVRPASIVHLSLLLRPLHWCGVRRAATMSLYSCMSGSLKAQMAQVPCRAPILSPTVPLSVPPALRPSGCLASGLSVCLSVRRARSLVAASAAANLTSKQPNPTLLVSHTTLVHLTETQHTASDNIRSLPAVSRWRDTAYV